MSLEHPKVLIGSQDGEVKPFGYGADEEIRIGALDANTFTAATAGPYNRNRGRSRSRQRGR